MIFKKKAHPLPSFPPSVATAFHAMAVPLKKGEYAAFVAEIEERIRAAEDQASTRAEYPQKIFEQLVDRTRFLLEGFEKRSIREQALICGAVRYFLIAEDPVPDEGFQSGFNDDAKVMNYVLEELGIDDRFIELR